jgi:hypothetical protein
MAIRSEWSAAALYTLLFATGCGRDIPPRTLDLGEGTTASPQQGASGRSAPRPSARPTKADAGTKVVSRSEDDAGTADPRDDDAGLDTPRASATARARSGYWLGTTSQGRVIEFDLGDRGLIQLRLSWFLIGCGDGDNKTDFDPPVALGDEFSTSFTLAGTTSLTVSGTFDGEDQVSGELAFDSMPAAGAFGCLDATATWNATRQAQ